MAEGIGKGGLGHTGGAWPEVGRMEPRNLKRLRGCTWCLRFSIQGDTDTKRRETVKDHPQPTTSKKTWPLHIVSFTKENTYLNKYNKWRRNVVKWEKHKLWCENTVRSNPHPPSV